MKITLVRLDSRHFPVPPPYAPLGLLYLASALEKDGFLVSIIDLNVDDEHCLWKSIGDSDIIGISMLTHARSRGFKLIEEIRLMYREDKKVVLGGNFPSSMPEVLLANFPIDAVIVGEGEVALLNLCRSWRGGKVVDRGIYSAPLMDIDTIPFPAWKHTNFDDWVMQIASTRPNWEINGVTIGNARWSPIIASRGCCGRCTFCNVYRHWGYKVRYRNPISIVDEMEKLGKEHGVTLFSFDDDAFPLDRNQCLEMCREIRRRKLQVAWKSDTRADVFDKEMLAEMRASGCFMLAIGIESGSEKILRNIRKGIDLDKARQAIGDMKDVGIIAYVLLMIGNIGETEDTILETIDFLRETKPNIYSYVTGVMVLPGTEMQRLTEIPDEYYLQGDGIPYYLEENTMEKLTEFSNMIRQVPMDY